MALTSGPDAGSRKSQLAENAQKVIEKYDTKLFMGVNTGHVMSLFLLLNLSVGFDVHFPSVQKELIQEIF